MLSLAYKTEVKETIFLSLPIVFGQLGLVMMGVADTVQVGHLGAAPIAAAGFANSVYWLASIAGVGALMVIGPQTATAKAQDNFTECHRIMKAGLRLGVVWGVFICLLFTFLAFNFHWFNQKPEVEALATDYAYFIAASAIPMMIFTALRQFTDGLSFTRVTMVITLGGLLLNVLLNWVFINGKFGFPAWGLNGAGLATLVARTAMAVGLGLFVFKDTIFKPFISAVSNEPLGSLLQKLTKIGLPGGLQLFFEVATFSLANIIAGWLGTQQQAAHSIAINLASVTYMVAGGFASAGAIRVGQAVGLHDRSRIVRAGTITVLIVIGFMGLACLVFLVFATPLTKLYTLDPQLVAMTASLVVIAGFFQLSDGTQVVGLGILRGISDVNVPTYITLVAYWVIGLPVAYLLAFPLRMDIQGIWYGLLLGLTVSSILLLTRFYRLTSRDSLLANDKIRMMNAE